MGQASKKHQTRTGWMYVTLYEEILRVLAINQIVPVEAIYSLSDNYKYVVRLIKKGITEGDIKKRTLVFKRNNNEYNVNVLSLSKSGFRRYAISVLPMEKISDIDFTSLSLSGGNSVSEAEYIRQAKMSEARILSAAAGARTSDFPKSAINETASKNKSFVSVLKQLSQDEDKDIGRIIIGNNRADSDIMFHNNREVKDIVESETKRTREQMMGYQRCLFNGIIGSQFKTVLMYSSYNVGFSWGKWDIQEDVKLGKLWSESGVQKKTYEQIVDDELLWGMFFVKNKRQFVQYYRDDAGRRSKETNFGWGFKNFYAVPKSKTGAKQLRFLMQTDDDKYNRGVANGLIADMGYSINTGVAESERRLFPVKDKYGNRTYIGIQMDVREIQMLERWLNGRSSSMMNIVCFEWQREYYEELFEKCRTTIIPMPAL